LPPPIYIPIVEEVLIERDSIEKTDAAINAFFARNDPVHVWIDCEDGEVLTHRSYDFGSTQIVQFKGATGNITDDFKYSEDPPEGLTQAYLSLATKGITHDIAEGTLAPRTFDSTESVVVPTYNVKSTTVTVKAGEPKKLVITTKPRCTVRYSAYSSLNNVLCTKYYGYLESDSYKEVQEQSVNATTRAIEWNKVFSTIGKVIKVISTVAEVLIPVLAAVVKERPTRACPAEHRLTQAIGNRYHAGKGRASKRKRGPKRLQGSAKSQASQPKQSSKRSKRK
jgi:hypothetical protein